MTLKGNSHLEDGGQFLLRPQPSLSRVQLIEQVDIKLVADAVLKVFDG
jgi:hypothetical protein